jgi:hypothetical protein
VAGGGQWTEGNTSSVGGAANTQSSPTSEPVYHPDVTITLDSSSSITDDYMTVNGTCHNCRSWSGGSLATSSREQQFIFALGPGLDLSTNDLSASLRRHVGYGFFALDMVAATGANYVGFPSNAMDAMSGTGLAVIDDHDNKSLTHAILFVMLAIGVVPVDSIVAGMLRRWPMVHIFTSIAVVGFMIGGLVTGVEISKLYLAVSIHSFRCSVLLETRSNILTMIGGKQTQKYKTGHQVLGLITFAIVCLNFVVGIGHGKIISDAKKRSQQPPKASSMLGATHTWLGRLVWLLLVINNGLGLKLAAEKSMFMIIYAVLVGAVVLFLIPIYFCMWRFRGAVNDLKEEDVHELRTIYDHPQH